MVKDLLKTLALGELRFFDPKKRLQIRK